MRNVILSVITMSFVFSFLVYADTYADVGEDHSKSIEVVLKEIRDTQGIGQNKPIDCELVTDGQLEELGEALMNFMHPDLKEHELMDDMMGGEGSESLRAMHIMMGTRYLGCDYGTWSGGIFPMMGPGWGRGMMGGYYSADRKGGYGTMMDGWGYGPMHDGGIGGLGWLWNIVIFVIIILGVVALVRWLAYPHHYKSEDRSPLDILKERYAKGEIDKQEFEEKKRDLM